jgi:hypothetical protein
MTDETKGKRMPLAPIAADLLLDDNLIWSDDMNSIRKDLAHLLISIDRLMSTQAKQLLHPNFENIVYTLTEDELDLTIPSVMKEYGDR